MNNLNLRPGMSYNDLKKNEEFLEKGAYYRRANSYSRSYRAHVAEDSGRHPLERAAKIIAEHSGASKAASKSFLVNNHDGEWHHVGKFANQVNYYDTSEHLKKDPSDLKIEINNSHKENPYKKPADKPQEKKIKCWQANYGKPVDEWTPEVTSKEGKHTFSVKDFKKELDRHEQRHKNTVEMGGNEKGAPMKHARRCLAAIENHRKLIDNLKD